MILPSTSNFFLNRRKIIAFGLALLPPQMILLLVLPAALLKSAVVVDAFAAATTVVSYSVANKYPKYSPSSSSPFSSSSSEISNLYDPPPGRGAQEGDDDNIDNDNDDDDESIIIRAVGGPRAHVYGEMTCNGFRSLAYAYNIGSNDDDDVFVDLGSGDGALVIQAAVEFRVKHSYGIELSKTHHEKAMEALNNVRGSSTTESDLDDRITLLHGDASSGDVVGHILQTATVIWCSNLLFDDPLQRRIADTVAKYTTTTNSNSNNNTEKKKKRVIVASLKPFPGDDGIKGFDLLPNKLPLEMSWTAVGKERTGHPPLPGHLCSVYIRRDEEESIITT